jgi:hypothetical protein
MTGNEPGHLSRRTTLDGDEDELGCTEGGGRLGRELQCRAIETAVAAIEIADPQPMPVDGGGKPRPQQQRDVAPGCRQAAAEIAPDAARTGDDDARTWTDDHACATLPQRMPHGDLHYYAW